MDETDKQESSFRELPSKEMKLKRHKIRKDSPSIPPLRLRLKNNASFMLYETDLEKYSPDRTLPSSPDSAKQELSSVLIKESSKTPSGSVSVMKNSCEILNISSHFYENEDYDQPLDMSKKHTDCNLTLTDSHISHQQLRPSVITCASSLLRSPCNLSDLEHNICRSNSNCDSNSNEMDYDSGLNHSQNKNDIKAGPLGHRREIVSGSCDPVIDEHFRRSLGKEYQNIFSKSAGHNVPITVDDHFAKALGETWHQIQQSKIKTNPVSSEHSSGSIQGQQTSQFLQPSEILL